MTDTIVRDRDEKDTVAECWVDDCDAQFLGMTPDDVREHIVEDHGEPLGECIVFPTDEARERFGRSIDGE